MPMGFMVSCFCGFIVYLSMHSISEQRDNDRFLGFMVPCPPFLDSEMPIGFGFVIYLSKHSICGQRDVDRFLGFMVYLSGDLIYVG